MQSSSLNILLIEDNQGDIRLIREIMQESNIDCTLHIVTNGLDAIDFLHKKGRFQNSTRPDLIFLDLNLPGKDGREILTEIKQDSRLKIIPVVVMTISDTEEDIYNSYALQANCYITKPLTGEQFTDILKTVKNFWFRVVELPKYESV